ncbi:MAG: GDSL family lipase [Ruminococcaceae bacterium]|nr:GDSL family lipase [Oscillospiraceae bacterium]
MKKIKVVFQGDSITDAGRDKRNYHHMGAGYPKYATELMVASNPDVEFEFINQGISGNRTSQLFDRFYSDALAFEPDIISILIGINDLWHRYGGGKIATTDAQFELNYRCILERIRRESNAKIMILSPFLLDKEPFEGMREDLERMLPIVRKLADEFADVYVPLDKYFEEALKTQPEPLYYSGDGVHPNDNGRAFIGKLYAEAIDGLIKQF